MPETITRKKSGGTTQTQTKDPNTKFNSRKSNASDVPKGTRAKGKDDPKGRAKKLSKAGTIESEGSDVDINAMMLKLEKPTAEKAKLSVQKTLRKASGGEALEGNRIGPDVVHDFIECTPIGLWAAKDQMIDYASVTNKDSVDIIPVSPRPEAEEGEDEDIGPTPSMLVFQQRPTSPAMSWTAELTDLEEDEFDAVAKFEEEFKLAYCLPREPAKEALEKDIFRVKLHKPDGTVQERERVRIILSETPTTFHVKIDGHVIAENQANADLIKTKNENYLKLCEQHLESQGKGIYCDRPSQTFLNRERDKSTQLRGIGVVDQSQICNKYIMLDEFNAIREMEARQKIKDEEDALMKALTENAGDEIESQKYKGSSDEDEDSDEDADKPQLESRVDWNKVEEYFDDLDEFVPEEVGDDELDPGSEEELDTEVPIEEIFRKREEKQKKHRPKLLPDISFSAMLLERIVSTTTYQKKHLDIRGFEAIFKKSQKRRMTYRSPGFIDLGPKIKRYWMYQSNLTKGKEVTCISVHPTNGNLVAVSYGSCGYANPTEGYVCIWNLKNINFPERVYNFDTSVTVISFSQLTPYLLAIGLLDGNIFVYDIRSSVPRVFCSTEKIHEKHNGPVWDLFWLQETEMASTGTVREVLVSVSDDGFLYRWTSAKGFEPWVLLKVRRSPIKIPGRREKRAEALISQMSASFTVCFYPDDLTTYLIGTEEGFIHKCITSYTETFIGTYVSHTGPVYKISFSPVAKDIFISCGGDWTVKIWKEDFPSAPLLTLCTGLRTVFDVAWSPTISSVIVCVTEVNIEVWDLTINTLEPIIQYRPTGTALRKVEFCDYTQSLLIGDDDGGVCVYALRNFPVQPKTREEQIDQLLETLIPGYRKRLGEDGKASFALSEPSSSTNLLGKASHHMSLLKVGTNQPKDAGTAEDAGRLKSIMEERLKSVAPQNL